MGIHFNVGTVLRQFTDMPGVVARRVVQASIGGLAFGFALGQHLSPSIVHQFLFGVLASLIVYRTRNTISPLIVVMASVAVMALLLQIVQQFRVVNLGFGWTVVIFFGCAALLVGLWKPQHDQEMAWADVLQVSASVTVVLLISDAHLIWNIPDSFAAISAMQEDNGTWLDDISRVLRRGGSFVSTETVIGGSVGALLSSLLVGTSLYFGSVTNAMGSSAVLNWHMFWMMSACAALVASRITYRLSKSHVGGLAFIPATLATILTFLFARGLIQIGHLTALVAATFLSTTFLILLEKPLTVQASVTLASVVLWGVASSWYPMYGLVVMVMTVTFGSFVGRQSSILRRRNLVSVGQVVAWMSSISPARRIKILVTATLFIFFAQYVMRPVVNATFSVSYISYQLSLAGGYAVVHPFVALLVIGLTIGVLTRLSSENSLFRLTSQIVVAAILMVAAFVAIGFLQAPYEPQYGTYKSLHLVTMAILPLAVAGLTIAALRIFRTRLYSVIAVTALTLVGALTYLEPYPQMITLRKTSEAAWWVNAAVKELQLNPNQLVLCLDSRGADWRGYDAYVCSRQLAGIQGRTSYETNVWTAANICQISSAQIVGFPQEFWSNLTIIVTNGDRLVNSGACDVYGWAGPGMPSDEQYPLGWLSGVPWREVRVIDSNGDEVKKSFAYLKGESGYTDEIIEQLERTLTS